MTAYFGLDSRDVSSHYSPLLDIQLLAISLDLRLFASRSCQPSCANRYSTWPEGVLRYIYRDAGLPPVTSVDVSLIANSFLVKRGRLGGSLGYLCHLNVSDVYVKTLLHTYIHNITPVSLWGRQKCSPRSSPSSSTTHIRLIILFCQSPVIHSF
jgi:hypothetical protein